MDTILAPINAAKAMGLVLVAIGTFHALAPTRLAEKYGVPSNEEGDYNPTIRRIGCSLLFTCVIVWWLIFQGNDDRYKAYALATFVWFVEHTGSVLNCEATRLGGSELPSIVTNVMNILLMVAFLNEKWAPTAAKVGVSLLLVQGITLILFPKFFCCKIWLTNEKCIEDAKHLPYVLMLVRACGIAVVQSGVMTALLEMDVDAVRAFGLSCLVLTLGLFYPFENFHVARKHNKLTVLHVAMTTGFAALTYLMLHGGDTEDKKNKTESD